MISDTNPPAMITQELGRITLPSCACGAPRLREALASAVAPLNLDPRTAGDISLALGEAFANAVEHGAGGAIAIAMCLEDGQLVLHLQYHGEPFAAEQVTAPDVHLLNDGGLGRYIMQQLMDEVEYQFRDGKTHVHMTKLLRQAHSTRLTPVSQAPSQGRTWRKTRLAAGPDPSAPALQPG